MTRFPKLLCLSLLAVACSFTTPHGAPGPAPAPAPSARPASIVVETSASGDHGNARVPVWANDPRWGDWDAPVTIVQFGDLECPDTKAVAPALAALKELYGPKKLRIVWKHLPLPPHDSARGAADAAATVFGLGGSDAFWKFQALAFQNQDSLDEDLYADWAEAAGVRRDSYLEAKNQERFSSKVDGDRDLASELGARRTPSFRINGVTLEGRANVEQFAALIDAELDKAEKLVASGTRPADVYVTLTNQTTTETKAPAVVAAADSVEDVVWHVPVYPDDPTLGPSDALVTIVEFSDFQCPFCKRVQPTLAKLMDEHTSEVRLVWKDQPLPFHAAARPSALLARAAYERQGDDGFWRAHDALFENQASLGDDTLRQIAKDLKLPWAPIAAAIARKASKKLDQSAALAEDVEARGTPQFFVNGVRLSGAQPLEEFEALFERRRAAAMSLATSGVPRDKIYETTIENGRKASEPKRVEAPPPDKTTPTRGPAGARVVIQVWSDFQCPFCSRVLPTLKTLEQEFRGRVQIVWRHNPLSFHKDAALASEAAQEVFVQRGAAAFWRYHDALFAAQASPGGLERASLETLAKRQGVNLGRFRQALDTHAHEAKVDADLALAKEAGLSGTPAFLINGFVLSGAQPITAFRRLVMRALAEQRPPIPGKVVP